MTRQIPWGAKVPPEFLQKVQDIRDELGWYRDADGDLLTCMAFETAETFDPGIRNMAGSGAVGLIQFTRAPAVELGVTQHALGAMTALEQLEFVKRYFARRHPERITSLEDMYMAILWPAAVGKPDDYTLQMSDTAYRQNSLLDTNKDGKISKYEAAALVRKKRDKGLRPGFVRLEETPSTNHPLDALTARMDLLEAQLKTLNAKWAALARAVTQETA